MAEADIERQIDNLKRQRRSLKTSLTRSLTKCQGPNITASEIVVRAEQAEEYFKQFENIQQHIEELTPDEHLHAEERYREEIEDRYYAIKSLRTSASQGQDQSTPVSHNNHNDEGLRAAVQAVVDGQNTMATLINSMATSRLDSSSDTPTISQQPATRHQMRLPIIQIPEFDGSVLEWLRFRDLFESMIDARSNISDVEKLEYLQTKLKGDALSVIKHLRPTNDNYQMAWELLKSKYNHSEKIKKTYLKLLLEHQVLKTESAATLQLFYNKINEAYNALKVLEMPVNHWDVILLYLLETKLDDNTLALWARQKSQDEMATFDEFLKFIDKRIFELDHSHAETHRARSGPKNNDRNATRTYTTMVQSCPICKMNHKVYVCDTFRNLTVDKRRDEARKRNLCFNCLQDNHYVKDCTSSSCKKCGKKHNTLLHSPGEIQQQHASTPSSNSSGNQPSVQGISVNMSQGQSRPYVLLPTAIIHIVNACGIAQPFRALLDSGSQSTLISEACAQQLGLKRKFDQTLLYGINASQGTRSRGRLTITVRDIDGKFSIATEVLCLSNLTQTLPSMTTTDEKLSYFAHLPLADQQYNQPAKIDVVLGADVFVKCVLQNKLVHPSGNPTALQTIFGWVLIGEVNAAEPPNIVSYHVSTLDEQLQKFWNVEEVSTPCDQFTPEEKAAEDYYVNTTTRQLDGRYVVRLPFKDNKVDLGESKTIATKRFLSVERKCRAQPQLGEEYKKFMQQYVQLGHMQLAETTNDGDECFLPHHAVFKSSSTTTKVRIVFDASCHTSNGRSLNDNLLIGAKQQQDLFDILIKFRKHEVGFTGDIEKMYRQIMVHPDDRKFQKILWRNPDEPIISEYQLSTVTYGTAAAPFLATRTLQEIAKINQESYPTSSKIIKEQFYVDDLMGCAADLQSALQIKTEVSKLLVEAGFHLRKWSSNSRAFAETIPIEDREIVVEPLIEQDQASTVNILGLRWNTAEDVFKYSVNLPAASSSATKRAVLSEISKIYDPVGWLAPVVISFKIFMQRLWLNGLTWDEQLPKPLYNQWMKYRSTIDSVKGFKIPRWVQYTTEETVELHGFADASELAYAAAIYMRVQTTDGVKVNLIAAKTRVAPLKQVSLPRLELCAAHLMVKLMMTVKRALDMPSVKWYGWTDSTVVLAWLSDCPRRWKSFIANRTSYIINVMPAKQWQHIKTTENPADIATRGIEAGQLIENKLWLHGPTLLQKPTISRFPTPDLVVGTDLEERKEHLILVTTTEEVHFMHKYSQFTKLIRTVAWMNRFITICQRKHCIQVPKGCITTMELNNARQLMIKQAQVEMFKTEIAIITKQQQLPLNNKLSALSPFLDDRGLLRVGGRLEHANIPFSQKHPIILQAKHHLTETIVRCYHIQQLHAGNRLLQCLLAVRYWIIGVKQAVRRCVYKCPACMRQRAQPFKQKMGNLPRYRFGSQTAFMNVGIDYAGPFTIRAWKGRGNKTHKTWVAVFVCLVTKAIHIELVTELTTTAFLAALRRFVARRGRPSQICTDNGTNFVGTRRHLQDLYEFLNKQSTQESVTTELAQQEINWHFSPPAGPHFGGIWEAGVKSVKQHLRRVVGDSLVTYEELSTVLCQIEACLNSRPLCLKAEDDINPLTPAHFLILRPMTAVIEEEFTKTKDNCLTRWNYVQKLVQQFWKRWSLEYIHQLQQRAKWKQESENITMGTIVLIQDENTPPTQWRLGKVTRLHPGADGLVRVVTLQTAKGETTRPVVKLCPLTVDVEERSLQGGPGCLATPSGCDT